MMVVVPTNIMRRFMQGVASLVLAGFVLTGCNNAPKIEPPKIGELEMYSDGLLNFGLKYPKEWVKSPIVGKQVQILSSADSKLARRFAYYDADGPAGARIRIAAIPTEGKPLDEIIGGDNDVFEASVYSAPTDATVNGMPAKKFVYQFELNDGLFYGEKYFFQKDSSHVTVLSFEAFGGIYDVLKPKFEEMLATSVAAFEKPLVPREVTQEKAEPFKPTENFIVYNGKGFTINVPDNFAGRDKGSKGPIEASTEFKGVGGPADCTIRIDVIDASKQKNLDKLTKENKPGFGAAAAAAAEKKVSLDGQPTVQFEYDVMKDIRSRVYFVVKGDKFFRIVLNWYQPERDLFMPTFEKSLSSIKFN